MTQIYGWLALIGVTYASTLLINNHINPTQNQKRVNHHCTISKITIPLTAAHLLSQPLPDSTMWVTWSGLGIYLMIIASGIVLMYLPDSGSIRFHARSLHSALLVGLLVSVLHHVYTVLVMA